jgi:hypothetical protein
MLRSWTLPCAVLLVVTSVGMLSDVAAVHEAAQYVSAAGFWVEVHAGEGGQSLRLTVPAGMTFGDAAHRFTTEVCTLDLSLCRNDFEPWNVWFPACLMLAAKHRPFRARLRFPPFPLRFCACDAHVLPLLRAEWFA